MNMSDIIVLLLPILVLIALWLFHWIEQRLPAQQRQALDQFARYAVKKIEKQYSDWPSDKKKAYADTIITALFEDLHLPVPSYALIDAAIEAVVYEIKQAKLPDEFVTGKAVNTGPITDLITEVE
jgi:LL-H family phage holin